MRTSNCALFALALAFPAMAATAAQPVNLRQDPSVLRQLQAGNGNVADAAIAAALGLSADESLQETRTITDTLGGTSTRYRQQFRGVPIWGEEIIVGRDQTGRVTSLSGRVVRDLARELNQTQPALTDADVLALMRDRTLAERGQDAARFGNERVELMIYLDGSTPKLSYSVSFFADSETGGRPTRPTFVVDAMSGEVLFSFEGLTNQQQPEPDCSSDCVLINETNISGGRRKWNYFSFTVPGSVSNGDLLEISISGGSGDADLYTRLNQRPTSGSFDCRPYLGGNEEACWSAAVAGEVWHVGIYPFRNYSGLTLTARVKSLTSAIGSGPGGNEKTKVYSYGSYGAGSQRYPSLAVGTADADSDACWMASADVRTIDLNHGTSETLPYSGYDSGTDCLNTRQTINGAYSPLNDAHYFGGVVFDMYEQYVGSAPLTFQLAMRVHYSSNYENAFWDGSSMTFGDGGSTFYPLVGLDVVSHEVSHGFTEQNSNLVYSGESGGINEAFSDIAGEAAEFFMRGSNDFLVGAEIYKASGSALRYMCNPTADGRSIDNIADFYASLDVHYSSGVYNKAFCELAKTNGWDAKTAFKAFARANQVCWTANTGFADGAQCVVDAAAALGYTPGDVTAAFAVVGINNLIVPSDPTAPAAPDGLMATAVSSNRIDLSWQDNSNNEDQFEIHRSIGNDTSFSVLGTVSANVTSYSDQNLDPEITYFYKVFAINPVDAVESNQASATTLADAGSNIDLTTSVTVQRNGRVRVSLSWSGAVGDSVDIFRDGSLIATTANSGSYNDRPSGNGPWTYQVCEAGSIDNCSAEVPASP